MKSATGKDETMKENQIREAVGGAHKQGSAEQPTGLMCELMAYPDRSVTRNPRPRFGWIVNDSSPNAYQVGYQILVAESLEDLAADRGVPWDSGIPDIRGSWQTDDSSMGVPYDGEPLSSHRSYYWKVRTWNGVNNMSPWSEPQRFSTGDITAEHTTATYPLEAHLVEPRQVVQLDAETYFVDFGRAAFGTVQLRLFSNENRTVEVRLGEVTSGKHSIDQEPGGSRRYKSLRLDLHEGTHTYTVEIPQDVRNTGPAAIRMPAAIGEVLPFRYCEVSGVQSPVGRDDIRQLAVSYPFDESAAQLVSSNRILNGVWELCKYSIKATSFCGFYVDGDRERIPYEADAYINQLSHYCCDREFTMARATHEYLVHHPTWPTEWAMHSVLIAWADYLYTGDSSSIGSLYDDLSVKTLMDLERADGLISTVECTATDDLLEKLHMNHGKYIFDRKLVDNVDWPQGERDGYVLTAVNTVVNAFHYRTLVLMERVACSLGRQEDASTFRKHAERIRRSINDRLFDVDTGVYVDGEDTDHSSIHANMFPLAFGLVPENRTRTVVAFIKSRGMACSVYGAQYLLDGLYRAGEADHALSLLTSTGERGWAHMIYDVGSTISLEAWDDRLKPNQDWNHAWGAVPANIIPRRLMGIRPLQPGWGKILIQPQPGPLSFAHMKHPTVRGSVEVRFENKPGTLFYLEVDLPGNTTTRIGLPNSEGSDATVLVDGRAVIGSPIGSYVYIDDIGSGYHTFEKNLR